MSLPNQLKIMQRARKISEVKEFDKSLRRANAASVREFEQRTGIKVNYVKGPLITMPAFKGSYKVPMAMLRLMLTGKGTDPSLTVTARHALLLPLALREIGVKDETLSKSVWYQELQDYQIEPMHALLMDRGYKPGSTDTKLSKMLKLIRAGKEDSPVSFGVGTGAKRVSFSDGKTMHYGLREHSVQWRGNSGRIRLNGKLVSIWEYLGDSVSVDERPLVLAAAASAKAEVDKRRKSIQKHEAQIAALDAVFELDAETPKV